METVFVSSISQIANSEEDNWKKINSKFNTGDLLTLQSAVSETDRMSDGAKQLFEDMQNHDALVK